MKIYNNTNITYSAIEQNKRNARQQAATELDKKMTQYTDTLSLSKTGQESIRHLSSVSFQNYVDFFEKEVSEVYEKDKDGSVKSDCFEHHVNRMAVAYDKMKNSIEEKYAVEDYEPEYYVSEFSKIEELTKEKELDMLNRAYESHSIFMATSTQVWANLQDFTPSVVYHKGNGQADDEIPTDGNKDNQDVKLEEKDSVRNAAYQAFMSAIRQENQDFSKLYSDNWKDVRLNLNISSADRELLNGVWDFYANRN